MDDEGQLMRGSSSVGLALESGRITAGLGRGKTLLRVNSAKQGLLVSTPDPDVAQIWLARDGSDWLVSLDESLLLAHLSAGPGSIDDHLDALSVVLRWELGHALLVPSVTQGASALPAATTVQLRGATVDEAIRTLTSNVAPIPGSPDELLELIVDRYREAVDGAEEVGVLASAGWDSRLEIAALHAAMEPTQRMHLVHVYSGESDRRVVEGIAHTTGATLTVLAPGPLLSAGLATGGLRQTLAREATWRPTVPLYATALASMRLSISGPVFGLVMTELKGRDYNQPLPADVPTAGKLRARVPGGAVTKFGATRVEADLDRQQRVWSQILDLSRDWPLAARRDYLWWQVNYGFTHSHRLRAVRSFLNIAPWHSSDVLARFMGLAPEDKLGNNFILYSLARLGSGLDQVPVIGSSGDGTHLTTEVSGDFVPPATERAVLFASGGDSPDMLLADFDQAPPPSLYAHSLGTTSDLALACSRSGMARDLLRIARQARDHRIVNAIQLADFMNTSEAQAESLTSSTVDE